MKKRLVRMTIEVLAETDRDAWEWGHLIARGIAADISENNESFAGRPWFVATQCVDVEDPVRVPAEAPDGR